MCTLAHVLESCGLATVALASIREQAERIAAPRTLLCDFPLGRPLGRPDDTGFQTSVLQAAFELLARPAGPVFETFPEVIEDDATEQLECRLPPRLDPTVLPAIDEARALRAAYQRTLDRNGGRTNFGRAMTEAQLGDSLAALDRIASGTDWHDAGLPSDPTQVAIDIRTYYGEAALSLAEPVSRAAERPWALERWFHHETEAGRLVMRARAAMKDAGAAFPAWFYMAPFDQ